MMKIQAVAFKVYTKSNCNMKCFQAEAVMSFLTRKRGKLTLASAFFEVNQNA